MGYDPEEATVDFAQLGSSSPAPKLLVVSMHLPVRVREEGAGEWAVEPSEGNVLRESLRSLKDDHGVESVHVGWTGRSIPTEQQDALTTKLMIDHACYPVYLSDKETEDFYYRFLKGVLWPTMNYSLASSRRYHEIEQLWATHRRILSFIADAITTLYRTGDVIWIHDYHLLCLPAFVRHRLPNAKIGFFLHSTFPSSELFRQLPIRESILAALCKADVVGFQTYQFCRYFLRSVSSLLWEAGYHSGPVNVTDPTGRVTRTHVDPTGLPVDFYEARLRDPAVKALAERWRSVIPAEKIVVGRCNRFDKYQGIVEKILAFDYFLMENPRYIERVVLIQLIIDGERDHSEHEEQNAQSEEVHESRSQLVERVQQLVGQINGRHGTLAWQPIHVHIKEDDSIDHNLALYRIADVVLITPIRDGMNLIAHESVLACQESHAPLVLSEFAGAASCLGGSIIVNPYDKAGVSDALVRALEMGDEEKAVSHAHNWRYVERHTSGQWAKTCLWEMIRDSGDVHERVCGNLANSAVLEEFLSDYTAAVNSMLVVDASVLVGSRSSLPDPKIRALVATLADAKHHTVFVMSSGDKASVAEWATIPGLGVCCGNGMSVRYPDQGDVWETQDLDLTWKDAVRNLYLNFCERTPGTEIIETDAGLVWSYAKADQAFAKWLVKDLVLVLHQMADKFPMAIADHSNCVEVRPHNLTTGLVCRQLATRCLASSLYYFGGRCGVSDAETAFSVKQEGKHEGAVPNGSSVPPTDNPLTSPYLLACDVADGAGKSSSSGFQYCLSRRGMQRVLQALCDRLSAEAH